MTVPAADYPIAVKTVPRAWRGDELEIVLSLKDEASVLVDPAGFGSSWAAMARTAIASTAHVDFTVVADSVAKTVTLTLPAATTATLNSGGSYGFDVQATGGAIDPITVWSGRFIVDGDYTHA